mgnify:CR=1 FL=1
MGEEAAVILERVKTADDFAIEPVPRKSVGNNFLGFWNYLLNTDAQFLQSRPLGLLNLGQVTINFFTGHFGPEKLRGCRSSFPCLP